MNPKCISCDNETDGKRKQCATCRVRKSRQKDLVRYSYNNLKHRANERGIPFSLTLEEFREFCIKSEYITKKGRSIGGYNIDRRIEGPFPGYTIDNIQIMDKQQNIKKYYDHVQKKAIRQLDIIQDIEDLPF